MNAAVATAPESNNRYSGPRGVASGGVPIPSSNSLHPEVMSTGDSSQNPVRRVNKCYRDLPTIARRSLPALLFIGLIAVVSYRLEE